MATRWFQIYLSHSTRKCHIEESTEAMCGVEDVTNLCQRLFTFLVKGYLHKHNKYPVSTTDSDRFSTRLEEWATFNKASWSKSGVHVYQLLELQLLPQVSWQGLKKQQSEKMDLNTSYKQFWAYFFPHSGGSSPSSVRIPWNKSNKCNYLTMHKAN